MPDKRFKVVLIQLPSPRFDPEREWNNVPLAAGYLKAMAHRVGLLEHLDIEILEKRDMDHAGDARLTDLVVSKSPNLVGFSVYIWNGMRTIHLCKEIKRRLPGVKTLVGGPEVTKDSSYILSEESIDFGCFGEGEIAFSEILQNLLQKSLDWSAIRGIFRREKGDLRFNSPRGFLQNLDTLPSPYLLKTFDFSRYSILNIEALRGCRHGCTYCNWATVPLRYFPSSRLLEELTAIINSGAKTVRFIESNLLIHPEFLTIAEGIRVLNSGRKVSFAAFANAELLTEQTVALLKECNFSFIDIGLQSVNSATLRRLRRPPLDKDKFVHATRSLEKYGIDYEVDTIIGLPGETYQDFLRTIDFVRASKFVAYATIPLAALPGTRIRDEAKADGIEFHKDPPYKIIQSRTMSKEEISLAMALNPHSKYTGMNRRALIHRCETSFMEGKLDIVPVIDAPITGDSGIRKIIIDAGGAQGGQKRLAQLSDGMLGRIENPLSVYVKGGSFQAHFQFIESWFAELCRRNPFVVADVVWECFDINEFRAYRHLIDSVGTEQMRTTQRGVKPALRKFVVLLADNVAGIDMAKLQEECEDIKFVKSCRASCKHPWKERLGEYLDTTPPSRLLIDLDGRYDLEKLVEVFRWLYAKGEAEWLFENEALYVLYEAYVAGKRRCARDLFVHRSMDAWTVVRCEDGLVSERRIPDTAKVGLLHLQMKLRTLLQETGAEDR
jgi:radical SAM superfamily enzyme YgiQ (UPF0313 family)